jgi:hypothetical protein
VSANDRHPAGPIQLRPASEPNEISAEALHLELEAMEQDSVARILGFFRLGQRARRALGQSRNTQRLIELIAKKACLSVDAIRRLITFAEWLPNEAAVIELTNRRNCKAELLTWRHICLLLALRDTAAREKFLKQTLSRGWSERWLSRKIGEYFRGPVQKKEPFVPRTVLGYLSQLQNMASRYIDFHLGPNFDGYVLRPLNQVREDQSVDKANLDEVRQTQAILDRLAVTAANRSEALLPVIARLEACRPRSE